MVRAMRCGVHNFVHVLCLNFLACAKNILCGYNERHHRKGPMDGVGGTVRNIIFRVKFLFNFSMNLFKVAV